MPMLPMENKRGEKFAFMFEPANKMHCWIFYDNHGQWVSLRPAMPHEVERAKFLMEVEAALNGIPTKGF